MTYVVTESTPIALALDRAQVEALRACGRRLASSKTWWGSAPGPDRPKSVIRVSPHDDGRWLVAVDNAVGVVAVSGLQLVVHPKIPLSHLLYLFGLSEQFPRIDDGRLQIASGSHLVEIIAASLIRAMEQVLRADLLKDYVVAHESLPFVRGTVHPASTTRQYYQGRLSMDCTHDDFLADIAINRVLKAALRRVRMLAVLPPQFRRRAAAVISRMDDVGQATDLDLACEIDRRSSYCADALALARIVLASTGLDWRADDGVGSAFLIRTPEMVEAAVRNIVAEEFGSGRVVKRSLLIDGARMTINPDLVFASDRATGDIKYKQTPAEWSRPDLYQAVAFAHAFHASKAVVITFSAPGVEALPHLRIGGTEISHVAWPADPALSPTMARRSWVSRLRDWLDVGET